MTIPVHMRTIGDAAAEAGVTTRAIRLWESKGLIRSAERTASRYRMFSDHEIAVLAFIRQAKSLGLTLREIGEILHLRQAGTSPCPRVAQALDEHLDVIGRALADLRHLRDALCAARNSAQGSDETEGATQFCPMIEHIVA